MASPKDSYGASCPSGGQFYVCTTAKQPFFGCCTTNPCAADGVCPDDDLKAASFDSNKYASLPVQSCAGSDDLWYTCELTDPPFMGCCASNACSATGGCPAGDLGAAEVMLDGGGVYVSMPSTSTSTMSSTSAKKTTSATSSTTSTSVSTTKGTTTRSTTASSRPTSSTSSTSSTPATATNQGGDTDGMSGMGSLSHGAMTGIASAATVVGLVLLAVLAFWLYRRHQKKKENKSAQRSFEQVSGYPHSYQESSLSSPYTPVSPAVHFPSPQTPAAAYMEKQQQQQRQQQEQEQHLYYSPNDQPTPYTVSSAGSPPWTGTAMAQSPFQQQQHVQQPQMAELSATAASPIMGTGLGVTQVRTHAAELDGEQKQQYPVRRQRDWSW